MTAYPVPTPPEYPTQVAEITETLREGEVGSKHALEDELGDVYMADFSPPGDADVSLTLYDDWDELVVQEERESDDVDEDDVTLGYVLDSAGGRGRRPGRWKLRWYPEGDVYVKNPEATLAGDPDRYFTDGADFVEAASPDRPDSTESLVELAYQGVMLLREGISPEEAFNVINDDESAIRELEKDADPESVAPTLLSVKERLDRAADE